ncbi:MAG: hypothetical protein FWD03_03135 [Defluviitaleaceae bacterium]|nr:hypothetical protein [Defluviitaleaceae bacterium]
MQILRMYTKFLLNSDSFVVGISEAVQKFENFATQTSIIAEEANQSFLEMSNAAVTVADSIEGIGESTTDTESLLTSFISKFDNLVNAVRVADSVKRIWSMYLDDLPGIKERFFDLMSKSTIAIQIHTTATKLLTTATNATAAAQAKLNLAMKLNPIGLIVIAVAALVAAIVHLWNTNEDFRENVLAAWDNIKERTGDTWGKIKDILNKFWEVVEPLFSLFLNNVVSKVSIAFDQIFNIIDLAMGLISGIIDIVLGIITGDWDRALGGLATIAESIFDFIRGTLDNFLNLAQQMLQNFLSFVGLIDLDEEGRAIIQGFINGMTGMISRVREVVGDIASIATNTVRNLLGINSPSRVFANIGQQTGQGFINGICSMANKAAKAAQDMAKKATKAASCAEIIIPVEFGDDMQTKETKDTLAEKVRMYKEKFDDIKGIVLSKLTDMDRKANDILRMMLIRMDNLLRIEGFNAGRNFFRALGDGLIAEQGNLLAQALGVANAIVSIFNAQQAAVWASAGSFATGLNFVPYDNFPAFLHKGEMVLTASQAAEYRSGDDDSDNPTIINQYFYGVREEQTAFQVYRSAQKAYAEVAI